MPTIDKDILKFLYTACIGVSEDSFKAAANRAYLDFCRTMTFGEMNDSGKQKLRNEAVVVLREKIDALIKMPNITVNEFDIWHKDTCTQLQKQYSNSGITLTIGQAQKWINMTIKYLYVVGYNDFKTAFPFLHIPIDNVILYAAKDKLDIPKLTESWSKLDSYKQYIDYQNELRNKIKECEPLRWELRYWIEYARITSKGKGYKKCQS